MDMNISNRTYGNKLFWINKRMFDLSVCILLLPLLFIISIILLIINIPFNSGSLFFIQDRMGKDCVAFPAIKFRTMKHIQEITRKHDDPIEVNTSARTCSNSVSVNIDKSGFASVKICSTSSTLASCIFAAAVACKTDKKQIGRASCRERV